MTTCYGPTDKCQRAEPCQHACDLRVQYTGVPPVAMAVDYRRLIRNDFEQRMMAEGHCATGVARLESGVYMSPAVHKAWEDEKRKFAALPIPRWWTCPTHGDAMPHNAWGCPECVRELREDKERMQVAIARAHVAMLPIWSQRMGAEQVREHVQRGWALIDEALKAANL